MSSVSLMGAIKEIGERHMGRNDHGKIMSQIYLRPTLALVFEFLGLYAGLWAFLSYFRPSGFLAPIVSFKGSALVLFSEFLSGFRWLMICLVGVGLAYFVRKMKDGWTIRDLGFKVHETWLRDIWLGIVIFSLTNVISLPWTIAVFPLKARLAGPGFLNEWNQVLSPVYVLVLTWTFSALATFFCALWEEIYWRGYLQTLFARKYAPIVGFFASLLFFSLGHYFNRPEWTLLDVFGAVIGGVSFCFAFYATGSLLVVAIAHTLSNLWWDYPFFQYLNGSRQLAYGFIVIIWLITLVLCLAGKREVGFFLKRIRELFASASWKMTAFGICLGVLALLFNWGQSRLVKISRQTTILVMAGFFVVALGVSFFLKDGGSPNVEKGSL